MNRDQQIAAGFLGAVALEAVVLFLGLNGAWILVPVLAIPLVPAAFEVAEETQGTGAPEPKGRRILRLVAGVIAYPAASVACLYVLAGHGVDAPIGAYAGVSLVFGALVGRWWMILIPTARWGTQFFVSYLSDPSCASCGEDDTWGTLLVLGFVLMVVPGTVCVALGVLARRVATAWRGERSK